ncbi:MAG: hypothetical protein ACI841_003338 [Planctomycetota bacterium]|jgi:hypothetical protein
MTQTDETTEDSLKNQDPSWYKMLDDTGRERVVNADLERVEQWTEIEVSCRMAWRKPILETAGIFAAAALISTGYSLYSTFIVALVGAVTGALFHRINAGQLLGPLIGIPMFYLALTMAGSMTFIGFIFGPISIGSMCAVTGMRRGELPGS